MTTNANETEIAADMKAAVHRLAANNDPDQLTAMAWNACAALMLHYRANIEGWQESLHRTIASGCRCRKCSEYTQAAMNNIADASAENRAVQAAADLLSGLAGGLPAAEPEEVEALLEEIDLGGESEEVEG